MSNNPAPIALDPDLEPWAKQPGESDAQYAAFRHHLDAGRGRVLARTADELGRNYSYLRAVAGAKLWRQRIQAYEDHRDQIRDAIWREKCAEAAEADAKVLGAAVGKVAQWLMKIDPSRLSDGDGVRLLDVVMRHRRQLMGPASELKVDATVTAQTQLDKDVLDLVEQMTANDPEPSQEAPREQ